MQTSINLLHQHKKVYFNSLPDEEILSTQKLAHYFVTLNSPNKDVALI